MPVELKTAANIKYINIKMKKKLKSNSEILYIIKDSNELCVKTLLFLLCIESLEKIDFEFMKSIVSSGKSGKSADIADDGIIAAMDFWKDKDILEYEITSAPNVRGANMDNIINIILNISRDINVMNDDEPADSLEFDAGLGIYGGTLKANKADIISKSGEMAEPEIIETEITEEPETNDTADTDTDTDIIDIAEDDAEYEYDTETEPETETLPKPDARHTLPVPVNVSMDELIECMETNGGFNKLIHDAQAKMQTMFNTDKITVLYNLYEKEKIESALILRFIDDFAKDGKDNLGYIESVALSNAKIGVLTLEQYEEKNREIREMIEYENKILKLFNAEDRKLKAKEKKYISEWKQYDFSDEMLLEGYKICLDKIKEFSIFYINSIFINWHRKGFTTRADVLSEFSDLPEGFDNGGRKKNEGLDVDRLLEKRIRKTLKF